ncbi:MAG: hypothetical protein N3G20_09470 [Verrucomicrobiae bacterium]|nr:hypothetical protein [Verrucomicrobiae bacterium]
MKTCTMIMITFSWAVALVTGVFAQPATAPSDRPPGEPGNLAPAREADKAPDSTQQTGVAPSAASGAKQGLDASAVAGNDGSTTNSSSETAATDGERTLRLNFRNAPLELVLNYLSEAAGFIIMPGSADVKGKVDVWSNQPLTKQEAIDVLNSVLAKNGYAAVVKGRLLKIVTTGEMKNQYSPVRSGSDPEQIPPTDEVVTQIIPLKFINAVQLSRDLQPLIQTTMAANEGGNSLIITDTQANIRRIAEIVKAVDTAVASVSKVKVTMLKYADAKAVANVIRDLFQSQQDTSQGRGQQGGPGRFFDFMRGGPGGPGAPGGEGRQAQAQTAASGRAPQPRVVAVADERSNAVIVSAPEDQMAVIDGLISELDQNVDEITELRVFHLQHADPQEMANLLSSLFPDPTSSQQGGGRGQFQFGGRFGGPFPMMPGQNNIRGATSANTSERAIKQTRVVAVPDQRTRSVVVSAARNLMDQIAAMIADLDSDPARKQKVFVFDVQNSDPEQVQEILQNLFPAQNYGGYSGTRSYRQNRAGTQLNTRAQQNMNMGFGRNATGFGNMGFGNTGMRMGGQ